jgi:hypothetical protein
MRTNTAEFSCKRFRYPLSNHRTTVTGLSSNSPSQPPSAVPSSMHDYQSHSQITYHFQARSQNCEKRLLASSCLSVHQSVRIEQLGPHWMDFHEI